jgi:hypothetical protein
MSNNLNDLLTILSMILSGVLGAALFHMRRRDKERQRENLEMAEKYQKLEQEVRELKGGWQRTVEVLEKDSHQPKPGRPQLRVVESWFGVAAIIELARWIKSHWAHSITVGLVAAVAVPTIARLPHIVDPPDRDDIAVTATATPPPTKRNGALLGPVAPHPVAETPPPDTTSTTPETTTTTPATSTPTTAAPTTTAKPTTARPTTAAPTTTHPTPTTAHPTTAAPATTASGTGQPRGGGPDVGGSPATPTTPKPAPTTSIPAPLAGGPPPTPTVPSRTCLTVIVSVCVGVR